MAYENLLLRCAECKHMFVFSAAEQEFFAAKNFVHRPKRCKQCQARRNPELHPRPLRETKVTCADCGAETTVPFFPRKNTAVFCRDCFRHRKEGLSISNIERMRMPNM